VTLVLAESNSQWALVAADCLSSKEQRPFDDDVTKIIILLTADGQIAFGFSGFATWNIARGHRGPPAAGSFRTSVYLCDALSDAAKPDALLVPTLDRLCDYLENSWPPALAPGPRPLHLAFAGFRNVDGAREPVLGSLSNDDPPDRSYSHGFRLEYKETPGILALGVWSAVQGADIEAIDKMTTAGRPASEVSRKLVATIRRAAATSKGSGVIGDICQTVAIARGGSMEAGYHTPGSADRYSLVHVVDARGGGVTSLLDAAITGYGPTGSPPVTKSRTIEVRLGPWRFRLAGPASEPSDPDQE
jgi:hypothetical protein